MDKNNSPTFDDLTAPELSSIEGGVTQRGDIITLGAGIGGGIGFFLGGGLGGAIGGAIGAAVGGLLSLFW
jgi:hypothetical protein